MKAFHYMTFMLLSTFIPQSGCLNILFVSLGTAGHVTSIFELAKAMKHHNITFLTQQMAKSYINSSSSLFRIIYTNDSPNAFTDEKNLEQKLIQTIANNSLLDGSSKFALILGNLILPVLNKTIDVLMYEQFDVVVAGKLVLGIPVLCGKLQIPCVLQSPVIMSNSFNLNTPNPLSLLTSKQMTQFFYRIYNAAFTARVMIKVMPKLIPAGHTIFQSLPRISGPFYDSFTLKNLLFSKAKCLNLISVPSTFGIGTYPDHSTKYLGAFVDDTPVSDDDNALTTWVKSKPTNSILFGAFGTLSIISYERMYNLMNGLAKFLLQKDSSFLLLALHNTNYDTYQTVLKHLQNDDEIRNILDNKQRVWIEKGFVKQKWVLQQKSIKVFLSHCGMGSLMEALYFSKPILGIPFGSDQFTNAIMIDNLNAGQSLFERPSALQNFLYPYDFGKYTFTSESVTNKILNLWTNVIYEKAAKQISLEMKHAGGVKRAVEEIEFFVNLDGNLDRFTPFQSTLSFYQRYMLDLLLVFIILPGLIIRYMVLKCCKRQRKTKTD